MNIETYILFALPSVLGVILAVAAGRDWLRRRRTQREINRALRQMWTEHQPEDWTAKDEAKWEKLGRTGMLGNDWRDK